MITYDIILIAIEILFAVALFFLAGYAEKYISTKWKLCYLAPLAVAMILVTIAGVDKTMLIVYLGCVAPIYGFLVEEKKKRKLTSVAMLILLIAGASIADDNPAYRCPNFSDEFDKAFNTMKNEYVLAEHKNIDWEQLYAEYKPQVDAAYKNYDKVQNAIILTRFTAEFNDGHVGYTVMDEALRNEVNKVLAGNDYGLSLLKLADGSVVAANVDSSLNEVGIYNGTVITKWDGLDIPTAMEKVVAYTGFPLEEHHDFYDIIQLAGIGGEVVEVSFIDESGNEVTESLSKIGSYCDRYQSTMEIITEGENITNLTWDDINSEVSLLRIRRMSYDSESYTDDNYLEMVDTLREEVIERREAGVKTIILDLRANEGGSDKFVIGVASLFAPTTENDYAYDGVYDFDNDCYVKNSDGTYKTGEHETYFGEDLWHDGNIIVLVSGSTVSGGDHMTKIMSDYPNVKIVGFTHSNNSGQGVGVILLSDGLINYSFVKVLNADGTPFVDAGADGQPVVPLDEKVELTKEAVKMMFDDGEDYLLKWVE